VQIGGAIVFVIGLITLIDRNFLSELLGTNLFSGAVYVLVITSALVCLLAFFGCFGAVKEIKCMLLTVSRTFTRANICTIWMVDSTQLNSLLTADRDLATTFTPSIIHSFQFYCLPLVHVLLLSL